MTQTELRERVNGWVESNHADWDIVNQVDALLARLSMFDDGNDHRKYMFLTWDEENDDNKNPTVIPMNARVHYVATHGPVRVVLPADNTPVINAPTSTMIFRTTYKAEESLIVKGDVGFIIADI